MAGRGGDAVSNTKKTDATLSELLVRARATGSLTELTALLEKQLEKKKKSFLAKPSRGPVLLLSPITLTGLTDTSS